MTYSPKAAIKNLLKNLFKSCMFLATYIATFRYLTCLTKNTRGKLDRWNVIISAFLCTFALLWEPAHRRTELGLYLFPRFMEALWNKLLKKGWVKSVPYGEVFVFSVAMGIIMYCY